MNKGLIILGSTIGAFLLLGAVMLVLIVMFGSER